MLMPSVVVSPLWEPNDQPTPPAPAELSFESVGAGAESRQVEPLEEYAVGRGSPLTLAVSTVDETEEFVAQRDVRAG